MNAAAKITNSSVPGMNMILRYEAKLMCELMYANIPLRAPIIADDPAAKTI